VNHKEILLILLFTSNIPRRISSQKHFVCKWPCLAIMLNALDIAAQRDEHHLDNDGASQLRSEDGWRSPSNSRPNSGSFSPTGMQRRWIDIVTGSN
jgi:hypothetical protein